MRRETNMTNLCRQSIISKPHKPHQKLTVHTASPEVKYY